MCQLTQRRPGSGNNMKRLKFRRLDRISSWHAHIAKQKLREEGEIEAEKNQNSGRTPPHFRVHASEHLRPPELNRSQECRNRAADHDVMEMRDDEIGEIGRAHV